MGKLTSYNVRDIKRFVVTQEFKFIFFGGISTLFAILCYPLLYEFIFFQNHINAYVASYFLNITFSFILQKYFVFKSYGDLRSSYLKFLLNSSWLALIAYFFLYFLMFKIKLNPYLANFIVVICSSILSFIVHKLVTFAKT